MRLFILSPRGQRPTVAVVGMATGLGARAAQAVPSLPADLDGGLIAAVVHAGGVEKAIMAILALFSAIAWGIVLHKARVVRRARRQSQRFLDAFWSSKRLDSIYQKSEEFRFSPVSQVFRAGYLELAKIKKSKAEGGITDTDGQDLGSVARSMRRATAGEMSALEAGVGFLATCGSTAPFIGLLGTVMGIVGAFNDIGQAGNANLATVAPGIGGALVATALGLVVAIPAVMAYNYFLARIRLLEVEMDGFSDDFLNIVKRHFF